MKIKVAIIGLGNIGLKYDLGLEANKHIITHARAFSMHQSFDLICGIDSNKLNRDTFTQEYKLPAYEKVTSALAEVQPDLMVISVPTALHLDIIRQVFTVCIPKMVLCEKPLAYDLDDAHEIVKICRENGVKLYVNYMRRSDPGIISLKERIATNLSDSVFKGVAWYTKGLMNNGSHFLNLLQYWFGKIKSVHIINTGRLWNGIDPEPDFEVKFPKGSVFFLSAFEENYSHYTVEMIFANERIYYQNNSDNIQIYLKKQDEVFRDYTILDPSPVHIQNSNLNYQWHVTNELANAFEGKRAELCSGDEALDTLISLNVISKTYE
jgi:predicted dehydrogenase